MHGGGVPNGGVWQEGRQLVVPPRKECTARKHVFYRHTKNAKFANTLNRRVGQRIHTHNRLRGAMFNSLLHTAGKGTPRSDALSALTETSHSWLSSQIVISQRKARLSYQCVAAPGGAMYLS